MNQVQNMPVMIKLHELDRTRDVKNNILFDQGDELHINVSNISAVRKYDPVGCFIHIVGSANGFLVWESPEEVMEIMKQAVAAEIGCVYIPKED